jgi:hypothetical protein
VQTIRAVELALGITVPGVAPLAHGAANFTIALNNTAHAGAFNADVAAALLDAVPILLWAAEELALGAALTAFLGLDRTPLTTKSVALFLSEATAEPVSKLYGRQLAEQQPAQPGRRCDWPARIRQPSVLQVRIAHPPRIFRD